MKTGVVAKWAWSRKFCAAGLCTQFLISFMLPPSNFMDPPLLLFMCKYTLIFHQISCILSGTLTVFFNAYSPAGTLDLYGFPDTNQNIALLHHFAYSILSPYSFSLGNIAVSTKVWWLSPWLLQLIIRVFTVELSIFCGKMHPVPFFMSTMVSWKRVHGQCTSHWAQIRGGNKVVGQHSRLQCHVLLIVQSSADSVWQARVFHWHR